VVLRMLPDVTGSRNSGTAATKPEAHMSRLVDEIATKFQHLNPSFPCLAVQWCYCKYFTV
jgi:hypothetical protein